MGSDAAYHVKRKKLAWMFSHCRSVNVIQWGDHIIPLARDAIELIAGALAEGAVHVRE
jgi:hypothetical protein